LQKILGEGVGGIKKIRTATTFPETANGSGLGTADATKGEFLQHHTDLRPGAVSTNNNAVLRIFLTYIPHFSEVISVNLSKGADA